MPNKEKQFVVRIKIIEPFAGEALTPNQKIVCRAFSSLYLITATNASEAKRKGAEAAQLLADFYRARAWKVLSKVRVATPEDVRLFDEELKRRAEAEQEEKV